MAFCLRLFLFLLLILAPIPVKAADNLQLDISFAKAEEGIVVAIALQFADEYYAYAHNNNTIGKPTNLRFTINGNGLPVWYPKGKMQQDSLDPSATVLVYSSGTRLYSLLPENSLGTYRAEIGLLLCSKRHCLPVSQVFSGVIPVDLQPLHSMTWREEWQQIFTSQTLLANKLRNNHLPHNAVQTIEKIEDNSITLPPPGDFDFAFKPDYADLALEVSGLGKALLLGLLAGLLLNIMPCVLPVLTFKINGLLLNDGLNNPTSLQNFKSHNIFFALGVLTFFTLLALLLGGANLLWGQIYQEQSLIILLIFLVFLMALSMLGLFSLPILNLKTTNQGGNRFQAWFSGVMATLLATPCSGPLLGGVLAWALAQQQYIIIVVFWSVGFGMALPYLLLYLYPKLVKILPRPGAWMLTFERLLGFALLGTVIYLLSILPDSKIIAVLSVLLIVSVILWLRSRYCDLTSPNLYRNLVNLTCLLIFIGAFFWLLKADHEKIEWQNFNQEYFISNLGKKAMLLEFTADWCPNCKFLEATVLTDANLRAWQERYPELEWIKVDLTAPNAFATRLCEALGSKSIPLTAIFPADEKNRQPLVIRDLYGKKTLDLSLAKAMEIKE